MLGSIIDIQRCHHLTQSVLLDPFAGHVPGSGQDRQACPEVVKNARSDRVACLDTHRVKHYANRLPHRATLRAAYTTPSHRK